MLQNEQSSFCDDGLKKIPMLRQKSAGAIIFLGEGRQREYLLVQSSKSSYWGFPKGWVEKGENEIETAKREVKEEVGLEIELIPGFREKTSFIFKQIHPRKIVPDQPAASSNELVRKEVVFFLAKPRPTKNRQGKASIKKIKLQWELQDYIWLPYTQARSHLKHTDLKRILGKAEEFLKTKGLRRAKALRILLNKS